MNRLIFKNKMKHLNLIKYNNNKSENKPTKEIFYDFSNIGFSLKHSNNFQKYYEIIGIKYEKCKKAVYIIRSKLDKKRYILKLKMANSEENHELQIHNILKNLKHPNIVDFVEFNNENCINYFIFEFIDGITLWDYITSIKNFLREDDIKEIFIQIVKAVEFLHGFNILHCDLKLENILIDDKKKIKLIDFDLSKICNDINEYISDDMFGTSQYIAPESFDLGIYSKKSDVWALGIIFYVLITKKLPYKNELSFYSSNFNRRNEFKHIDMKIAKEIVKENNYSDSFMILLKSMLEFKDENRISIKGILEFEWKT